MTVQAQLKKQGDAHAVQMVALQAEAQGAKGQTVCLSQDVKQHPWAGRVSGMRRLPAWQSCIFLSASLYQLCTVLSLYVYSSSPACYVMLTPHIHRNVFVSFPHGCTPGITFTPSLPLSKQQRCPHMLVSQKGLLSPHVSGYAAFISMSQCKCSMEQHLEGNVGTT